MTTISFVAGRIPLAMSSGVGSATNRAISSVIIGGQMLSLLLTLVAIPVIYTLFDDLSRLRFCGRVREMVPRCGAHWSSPRGRGSDVPRPVQVPAGSIGGDGDGQ